MTKITVLLLAALLAHPFDSPAEDTPVTSETDWTQKLLATRPAPRDFFALAYDAAQTQVVLFGGFGEAVGLNLSDSWVWDGTTWTQKHPPVSPPGRTRHSMTYDEAHGQVVLFGGSGDSGLLGDTWVWDGTTWTQQFPSISPSPRSGAGMVYDSVRRQVVLFGGAGGVSVGDLNDTWTWDGTNWHLQSPSTSPPARHLPGVAFDAARGQVVMFAGSSSGGFDLGDTWVWDGTAWTQETSPNNPSPRQFHSMAYDAVRQKVLLFSGGSLTNLFVPIRDTWTWDGTKWEQVFPAASPPAAISHQLTYDSRGQVVVLFGGATTNAGTPISLDNETWLWGEEFRIFLNVEPDQTNNGIGSEPSIAVDPLHPLHAVVGFNDASGKPQTCGWAETTDGGVSWRTGSLRFPIPFFGRLGGAADPWVRYSPDGQLFYSCLATNTSIFGNTSVGVFVAVSGTGLAIDLEQANLITQANNVTVTPLDHPSIGVFRRPDNALILVECWANFSNPRPYIEIAVSNDGRSWSPPRVIAPRGRLCAVGGDGLTQAVTWVDDMRYPDRPALLKQRTTSTNGLTWDPPMTVAAAGDLLIYQSGSTQALSTTDKVLTGAYTLVIPGQNGLRTVGQIRSNDTSQVFIKDPAAFDGITLLGDSRQEKFLPGTGSCGRVIGTYQVTSLGVQEFTAPFRYTVWLLDGEPKLLFTSGADLNGQNGFNVGGFSVQEFPNLRTINEYTGTDCSGNFGWAAWTDLRKGIPGKPEIWGARILLPK